MMPVILAILILTLASTNTSYAIGGEDTSGMNTINLVDAGVKGIPDCINYCVVGVCVHLRIRLFSVSIYVSPRVEHNTPEFVVSTFRAVEQQPWMEWREVFSSAQNAASNGVLSLITNDGRMGGYGAYTEEHGIYDRQEVFKEVDINGNPLSMLPILLSRGGDIDTGSMPPATRMSNLIEIFSRGDDEDGEQDEFNEAMDTANEIVDTAGFPAIFLDPALLRVFSYMDTANQIRDSVNTVTESLSMLSQIADLANSPPGISGGLRVDYLMCPNSVIPFTPYYLSSNDLFGWRLGIPDRIFHAGDIARSMIPFMGNRMIVGSPDGGMPGLGEGNWSPLYPRTGFVRNSHDGKVGSVTAQRAIDLLLGNRGRDNRGYTMLFSPSFPTSNDLSIVPYRYSSAGVEGGVWQELFPTPSYQCTTSLYQDKSVVDIANDRSAPRSTEGRYAWAFWRRYNCCLQRRGNLIASTSIPPICLSANAVPEPQAGSEEY